MISSHLKWSGWLPLATYSRSVFVLMMVLLLCDHVASGRRHLSAWSPSMRRYKNNYPRPKQMYCSNGFHLQMFADGTVNGTRQDHSKYGVVEIINEASNGIVSIRGLHSNRYLCMNSRGRLKAEKRRTLNCIFVQEIQPNYHNTYYSWKSRSKRNKKYYIAINRKGKMRKGRKTKRKHKSAHFLLRNVKISKKLYRKYMRRIRKRIKKPNR